MRQFYFIFNTEKTVCSINSYPISLAGRAGYKINKEVWNIEDITEFKHITAPQ